MSPQEAVRQIDKAKTEIARRYWVRQYRKEKQARVVGKGA